MDLWSLLKKEALWSRHRALSLLFVLLVLPGLFAYTTVIFQSVVPEDAAVAVAPTDESVTEDELTVVQGGAAVFSDPRVYEDTESARRALNREAVYGVLAVPPGYLDASGDVRFRLYVDGSVVPFVEPSAAIAGIMERYLDGQLDADVTVERVVVGDRHVLAEYLLPVFLLGIVMLFAFAYLPYNLARESAVLDRLRVSASLEAVIAAKILYFGALMLVPIGAFFGAAALHGYEVPLFAPGAILVYLLTFGFLAAISASIMVLTAFSTLGRFLNVALMFGALTFSSLVYPAGFFSPLRAEIARLLPLHYSMVVIRGLLLRDAPIGLFADYLAGIVGFALLTVVGLKLSIVRYERSR